jgi:putative phosphoribosyl transferase
MDPEQSIEVVIPAGPVDLEGTLALPSNPAGVVVFAHGSGSSRHSSRNQAVAEHLRRGGFGTLLFDLLTPEEAEDRSNVFNIWMLAERLAAATRFLRVSSPPAGLPIAYFGASTGAAAALMAAGEDHTIAAAVSRGGRPDLARELLPEVAAPTLLIVGSLDYGVIELNQEAFAMLRCEKRVEIVPGATHLFEEPGRLQIVAELALRWFTDHVHSAMHLREAQGGR